MAINIQHSIIGGRLTKKPEVKHTLNGTVVCPFTIAVNVGSGERAYTEFNECVAYGKTAELIARHFDKGSEIFVTCQRGWRTRTWEDRGGQKRYKTEHEVTDFCFVGARGNLEAPTTHPTAETPTQQNYASPAPIPSFEDVGTDDDLPF